MSLFASLLSSSRTPAKNPPRCAPRDPARGPGDEYRSRIYGDATVLTGTAATAAAVMHALDGATVAHLACHGHFRSDSPLFSSLELADGPLSGYQLQRLRRAPELIVLENVCGIHRLQNA